MINFLRMYPAFLVCMLSLSGCVIGDRTPAPAHAVAQKGVEDHPLQTPIGGARIAAVYDLDASPPYAYALERGNLRVLDIRDPGQVEEVANLEFERPRLWSVIHGSGLYMGGFGSALAVVDLSEPRQPRWVGEHPDVHATRAARGIGDRLYVIRYDGRVGEGKVILDVLALSEAAELPRRLATLEVEREPTLQYQGVAHDAGRLFILLRQTESAAGEVVIVNVEDPSLPVLERRIELPEGPWYLGIAVRGDLCYLITFDGAKSDITFKEWRSGLAVLRLDEVGGAVLLGSVTDERLWAGGGMIVNGDAIYASFKGEAMLGAFDVSDPQSPKLAYAFVPDWHAAGLGFSVAEDRLYVAGDPGSSPIFDISSPLEPQYLGRWDYFGGWAADVVLHNRLALIRNRGTGFLIYDVEDPTTPTRVGVYTSLFQDVLLDNLASDGDRILLSHGPEPSELVDISDPAAPALLRQFPVPEAVAASVLRSTLAIQAYAAGGLGIVDLTNPDQPLSHIPLDGAATELAVHRDLAVVAHRDGGISVIDIEIPESPVLLGRAPGVEADDEDQAWRMVTQLALSPDGTRAFTVRGEIESNTQVILTVFDIRTSQTLGRLDVQLEGWAYDFPILTDGDEVLLGAGWDLVRIDVSEPDRPSVRSREHLKMSMEAEGFARQGELLFVAASEGGMQVFKLTNR